MLRGIIWNNNYNDNIALQKKQSKNLMYFCNGFYELKPNVLTISEYFLFHTNWIYEIHETKKKQEQIDVVDNF